LIKASGLPNQLDACPQTRESRSREDLKKYEAGNDRQIYAV
jgi:hypothetical protein